MALAVETTEETAEEATSFAVLSVLAIAVKNFIRTSYELIRIVFIILMRLYKVIQQEAIDYFTNYQYIIYVFIASFLKPRDKPLGRLKGSKQVRRKRHPIILKKLKLPKMMVA
jgi:hypothetical protein